jgi:FKBP-type peptidyl-prolyl cis-trans isomerase FkpA
MGTACHKTERFKGFSESETGLFYKFKKIGNGNTAAKAGDYFLMRMIKKTMNDSVYADSLFITKMSSPSFKGSFEEGLAMMNEGDVYEFIQRADSFYNKYLNKEIPPFIPRSEYVKLELRLRKIIPEDKIDIEKQRLDEDRDMEEQTDLLEYIKENHISAKPINSGLYYIPISSGKGQMTGTGKYVVINYTGSFLDGRKFETTFGKVPLDFTVGEQYQVIKGLETGITLMREGDKAKFIIPSQLAYGEKGSSTGIVPPYATLIYEVELLTVK